MFGLLPHILSLSRIVAAWIIWLWPTHNTVVACIVWGGFSDWADGYLARHLGVASRLGAMLDPIGDKILVGSLVLFLYSHGLLPLWWISIALGRDVLILLGGLVAVRFYGVKDMPPTFVSKLNTALQLLVVLMAVWPLPYVGPMMVVATLTTFVSGFQYASFLGCIVRSSKGFKHGEAT